MLARRSDLRSLSPLPSRWRTPAPAETARLPLFSHGLFGDLVFEHGLGQEFLQARILGIQFFEALGLGDFMLPNLLRQR